MATEQTPAKALALLQADRNEILDVYRDSDEQECAFFDAELARLDAAILLLTVKIALAAASSNETPALTVLVRRDVREFGPKLTRTINPGLRATLETYRHEQTRFDFAPTSVDETLEVVIIDETCGQFRLELASEQHLWTIHSNWTHDPVPTVVADSDLDGSELVGRGPYTVRGVAA